MAETYAISKKTLDDIAGQSMELAGKTSPVSTAEIKADLTEANAEVKSQTSLITQIKTALEGKAAGGGGVSWEVITLTSDLSYSQDVYDTFSAMVDDDAWFTMFVRKTETVRDIYTLTVCCFHQLSNGMGWVRTNQNNMANTAIGTVYDTHAWAGDEYYKVVYNEA